MKANEYALMTHAVEVGLKFGVRRAYKYVEGTPPTDEQIGTITNEVMNSICEWFIFNELNGDE